MLMTIYLKYTLGKNEIERRTKVPLFLGSSACAAFLGIWRNAGAFFVPHFLALNTMRA